MACVGPPTSRYGSIYTRVFANKFFTDVSTLLNNVSALLNTMPSEEAYEGRQIVRRIRESMQRWMKKRLDTVRKHSVDIVHHCSILVHMSTIMIVIAATNIKALSCCSFLTYAASLV